MTKKELFMANVRGELTDRSPIWIMRQAGRYLPEYQEYRKNISFEDLCRTPKAAAEVTAQPVEILDLDAAIIFSDILLILEPLGIDLKFSPGPIISPLLEKPEQVKAYKDFDPAVSLGFVGDAIVETRKRIGADIPLLGFCGAPFTLFCYLCGTKESRIFYKPLNFIADYPSESKIILDKLAGLSIKYLRMQLAAGADAVQIFDTWAGELSEDDFALWSFPYLKKIIETLHKDSALISIYVKGSNHFLEKMRYLEADIYSLDHNTPLKRGIEILSPKTLQGNLDPNNLLLPETVVISLATAIMGKMSRYPGFIFNLGHGILPRTPVENVKALVRTVHNYKRGI